MLMTSARVRLFTIFMLVVVLLGCGHREKEQMTPDEKRAHAAYLKAMGPKPRATEAEVNCFELWLMAYKDQARNNPALAVFTTVTVDASGKRLDNVSVILRSHSNTTQYSAMSDPKGCAVFENVLPGTYNVIISDSSARRITNQVHLKSTEEDENQQKSRSFFPSRDLSNLEWQLLFENDLLFSRVDFTGATLALSDFSGSVFMATSFRDANLNAVRFKKADFVTVIANWIEEENRQYTFVEQNDFTGATMLGADLTGALLKNSRLVGTNLTDANMEGTIILTSDVAHAVFEPKVAPSPENMANVQNLQLITYNRNPHPLLALKGRLQELGYLGQAKAANLAIRRTQTDISGAECTPWGKRSWPLQKEALGSELWKSGSYGKMLYSCGDFILNRVFFDWTSNYGSNSGRPLSAIAVLWGLFACCYLLVMNCARRSGIELARLRTQREPLFITVRPGWLKRSVCPRRFTFGSIKEQIPLLKAAMLFSLLSACNLGFRDVDFGRWVRMLMRREYAFRPFGWARTISGIQALLSVYLLALAILSYFGNPFDVG